MDHTAGNGSVGLVGAGRMGFEMVRALVDAGLEVFAYDPDSRALERAVTAGAVAADSPAEVAVRSPTVLLSLPGPEIVREAVCGKSGILSHGEFSGVIVDTSTVDPETSRDLARLAASRSVGYLDAPVLGRPDSCGRWTLPVGGEAAHLESVAPVLGAISDRVLHVGPVGLGNTAKLLNNLMFGAIGAVTAEVFAASRRLGLPEERFFDIVAGSEAATVSPLFRSLGAKVSERDFSPVFSVDLLRKDVDLAVGMIESSEGSSPLGHSVLRTVDRAVEAGYGAEDVSAIVKVFERDAQGNGGS